MQLKISCTQCDAELLVPSSAAGKGAACPNCRTVVKIPKLVTAKPIDSPAASFTAPLPPTQAPGFAPNSALSNPADFSYAAVGVAPVKKAKANRYKGSSGSRGSGNGLRIVLIIGGVVGGLLLGGLLLVAGLAALGSGTVATLSPTSVPVPKFPDLGVATAIPNTNVTFQYVKMNQGGGPGQSMQFRVYLPLGQAVPGSLPCVLLAPAGTNLLHGNQLDAGDYHAEALPYAQAGMAVVCFSLDGEMTADPSAGDRAYGLALSSAYKSFMAAKAGVVNGRNALDFALQKLPQVNPKQIFSAGHSSAATASLLMAAHEPRLAGAIAYAPITNLEVRLEGVDDDPSVKSVLPGITTYLRTGSPIHYVDRYRCPLFIFHARDDSNEPFVNTDNFVSKLSAKRARYEFATAIAGDHYDSMIQQGIPKAVQWIRLQCR